MSTKDYYVANKLYILITERRKKEGEGSKIIGFCLLVNRSEEFIEA